MGICEPMDERREEVAVRYKVEERFQTLEQALERDWQAAVIAVPAHLHVPIAAKLAGRKIDLLIEKPLSTTIDGIETLIRTVKHGGLVVGVAYVYRAHPGVGWLREALDGKKYGKPVQLVITSGQNFPFYRPAYREIYYTDRAKGGGAIQDCLSHHLNLAEYLVGPIDRIAADAKHQILEGVEVEDTVHAFARHGEVMSTFSLNQYQAPNETTVTVVCEKGTLRFELHENRCRLMTEPGGSWIDKPLPAMERDDWFVCQEKAYLDAVEQKRPVLCTLEEGFQTLRVSLAMLKSVEEGGCFRAVTA